MFLFKRKTRRLKNPCPLSFYSLLSSASTSSVKHNFDSAAVGYAHPIFDPC
jgi:hypothetical protein